MRWTMCLSLLAWAISPPAHACGDRTPCELTDGQYFVRAPKGWDGRSPLPVVFYFHGYRSSAREAMDDAALAVAIGDAGALLVAPDGRNRSWTIPDALSTGRDDLAFVRAIMEDVAHRFPVDHTRSLATGFSAGGFLVWAIACRAGKTFAAYVSIAGAFLDPVPQNCPTGPVSLRHIHGARDATVPMAGRWIASGRVRQADIEASMARLRAVDGCPEAPNDIRAEDGLTCRTWSAARCSSGKELALCLHDGGHEFKPVWIVDALRRLSREPASARRP